MFFRFANPQFLILLILIPLLIYLYLKKLRRGGTIRYSNLGILKQISTISSTRPRHLLFIIRIFVLTLLIIAFARPQSGIKGEEVITQGVDIILAIDISSSMLAEDIKPNRVEAVKAVASEFIKRRKSDRIGMVVFAGEAYTQCPLTLDYGILLNFLEKIKVGIIEDGTAIGMGLATAVNRLRSSQAKSKLIILLTDGRNNTGEIDPITAAQAAQAFDIRVYTIGAGTKGSAMYPVNDPIFGKRYVPVPVDIDESTLKKIAEMTGGKYFRATNRKRLSDIYREIDKMEKTKIKVKEYTRYSELFYYFAGIAFLFIMAEIVLANTTLRKIP